MELIPLPAFTDNYIWLMHDGSQAVVVDPGDAQPVLTALQQRGLTLQTILVTHHHNDHTGGVAELHGLTQAQVYGPLDPHLPTPPYTVVREGQQLAALGLAWQVLEIPGHTQTHIAFYNPERAILFCGDTLFSGGCGRLLGGTAAQLHASLTRLAGLPGTTQVYCGHEYTLANLRFALTVEPDNAVLQDYLIQCENRRNRQQATLPSILAVELQINPFLRIQEPRVLQAIQAHDPTAQDPVAQFAALRLWKNTTT